MNPIDTATKMPVFELKGSVVTILVLHIKETDADCLYPQLEKKMGKAHSFFNSAPVLIDLSAVDAEGQEVLDFMFLAETLRRLGLVPVGVRGSVECESERVLQAGLGLLPSIKTEKTVTVSTEEQLSESVSVEEKHQPESSDDVPSQTAKIVSTKVVTLPVRSGQQVFAPEGDLIILSSVNAGAEVLAAGNIHVYGALRGRAMAGIHGDTTARIISLQCNPELVAVAGEYVVNELLDETLLNHSVIISLEDGRLKFAVVGSFNPSS
jgi:septum site-determining protein MinC